jgi:hypothetical protein
MRSLTVGALAIAAFGFSLSAGIAPASAQVARPQLAADVSTGADFVQHVRWRGHHHRSRHWHRHGPSGAAIGLGIAAGIIGAGIAASAAAPPPVYVVPNDAVAYCMRKFRSYDPASGTYLGYDGYRHPCP